MNCMIAHMKFVNCRSLNYKEENPNGNNMDNRN